MLILKGQPVAAGFAEGTAFLYGVTDATMILRRQVGPADVPGEVGRFREAVERASRKLHEVRDWVRVTFGDAQADIFSAHLAMLHDPHLTAQIERSIRQNHVSAEQAVQDEVDATVKQLAEAKDPYFRELAQDIRDIGRRVLRELLWPDATPLGHVPPRSVIVAHELLPSDAVGLDRDHVVALVTERGGATSHTAILARSMGIPAVTGVSGALHHIRSGAAVLVDGSTGEVTVEPTPHRRSVHQGYKRKYDEESDRAAASEHQVCQTLDGTRISLYANISRPEEVQEVHRHRLDGVGLFRTEFLFMGSAEPPTYPQHLEAYRGALRAANGLPLVIRTLDLGGDKIPPFLARWRTRPEGAERGIRFAMAAARDLLEAQVRAMIDAGQDGDLRILLPMVLGGDDLGSAIQFIQSVAGAQRLPPIGAMIETPSALFQLDAILEQADFVSVGTSDLIQFLLATSRESAGNLWSLLHPSALRAMAQIVDGAARHNKPLSVCGEVAGEPALACLMVGLGVRALSVSPARAGRVRMTLQSSHLRDLQRIAQQMALGGSIDSNHDLLRRELKASAETANTAGESHSPDGV